MKLVSHGLIVKKDSSQFAFAKEHCSWSTGGLAFKDQSAFNFDLGSPRCVVLERFIDIANLKYIAEAATSRELGISQLRLGETLCADNIGPRRHS